MSLQEPVNTNSNVFKFRATGKCMKTTKDDSGRKKKNIFFKFLSFKLFFKLS